MLEKFEYLTEAQIKLKYALLSDEEKELFVQHLLPLVSICFKTMMGDKDFKQEITGVKNAEIKEFPKGMTIRELKEYVKDLPEHNPVEEEPLRVWIGHDQSLSSVVKSVYPLNLREYGSEIMFKCE